MNSKIDNCERVRKKRAHSHFTDLITVFLIQLVLTLPFYTANVYGLTISNVRVTKVTSNSATIEWDTNNISNGKVKYGKTTSLGFTQRHDDFILNHSVKATNGIDSETTYFFAVESTDLASNTAIDNNSNSFYTFKTTDITPPSQVKGVKALSSTSNSISLSWDILNISDLSYYIIYLDRIPLANTTTNSFDHTNLDSSTSFSYKVSAVDNSGNEGAQSDTFIASTLSIDSTPPVISNVDALTLTDTTAKITWLTNENSTTIVLYGVNKTDKTKISEALVTNHSITIDSLTKNLTYLFTIKSCDSSNNCANSSNNNFTAGQDITPPFINVSIPRYVNRRTIDIIGNTEPFSSVTLFVNDMIIPLRSLNNDEIGTSGKFIFSQIQLENDNVIKITAVDKSGNKNEKTFDVTIDTESPIVQLDEVPSLTSQINLTISGTVNEFVTIKAFVTADSTQFSLPSKITGLNATKIGQNSVELQWDESTDQHFSHYVVYRADASPIAVTKPANFNLFIDALVDSGRSYTYQVSAIDIFGNEGPQSDPITATTLEGGAILNLNPPVVDIFEDLNKPSLTINASATFNFGIKLDKGDTTYKIKLIFEDRAENSVVFERSVTLDTKKPIVKITSPPSGAFIFENVANEVDVVGKTEPFARVHLFVDRTPFSFFNASFELSGLPNEVQNLPEAQLDAKCRLVVASKSFCSTGADFSVTADSEGNFKFERVDLTAVLGGAARLREVPATDFRDTQLNQEAQESKKTTLVVIATDQVGLRGVATQAIRLGTCWSGNQSWDIIPLQQYQSPTLLSTERLAEGTETIYFYFNYSYIGIGKNAKVTSVSLSKACGTRELLDPRFNISCQVLQSGASAKLLNPPDNTVSYSAVPLSKFPGMDRFLEDDWKSFFKGVNNELSFPFKVTIRYQHDTDNDDQFETETQTTCEQVSYVIDKTVVDPRKVLPDWLLFDFVDFLQGSIETLTEVQKQVDQLLDYVAIGCVSSFVLTFAVQVYRRWVTFWDEKVYVALKKAGGSWNTVEVFEKNPLKTSSDTEQEKEDCQKIIQAIAEKKGSFQMKYMTDADVKKCFPNSASAWNAEANIYQLFRYSCDRVFGHSAPARWTETKTDTQLYNKVTSGEGCAVDQSVRGQPLRVESCTEFARNNPTYKAATEFGQDAKCTLIKDKDGEGVYTVGNLVSNSERLYELKHISATGGLSGKTKYAVRSKQSEFNYITAQTKSCAEICGAKQTKQFTGPNNEKFTVSKEQPKTLIKKPGPDTLAGCSTVDTCRTVLANKIVYVTDAKGETKAETVTTAETRGYTSNCFYEPNDAYDVVSDSAATREECCCINAKEGPITPYYQPGDTAIYDQNKYVHESKTASGIGLEQTPPAGYDDMKWSYRYWKEKFEAQNIKTTYEIETLGLISGGPTAITPVVETSTHTQYNPNRYIDGRDFPACFGQNNWLYEPFKPETVLTVDPFRQHESSLFCIHLAGISNRLQFIKNLMNSMSTCLIQVRTTGRGDAGACKELFTQYLCNSFWQIIRWFVDGCVPIGAGVDFDAQTDTIAAYLKAGFKGVYDSASDLQSQVSQEYGNARLNELLGTGEESVARKVCLFAFGYDWELNIKNIVDAAYTTPFATLVQPVTRSREFLTVEPTALKPKYEYRASWVINPGCEFERYDVYLTCVGRKQLDQYPNSVNCGALGAPSVAYTGAIGTSTAYSQCDCIYLPDEKVLPGPIFSGRLKQNVLEDRAIPSGQRVVTSDVRYDHLKFVLRADRKIPANIKPNCFPTGYDDGVFYFPLIDKTARDLFDCRVDYASGSIICGEGAAFTTRKGIAYFTDVRLNDERATTTKEFVVGAGEDINIQADVYKLGQDKCLRVLLDGVEKQIVGITINGTYSYPVNIPGISLGQVEKIDGAKQGLEIIDLELNNDRDVSIFVKFYDMDESGDINFLSEKDQVAVENNVREKIINSKYFDRSQGFQGAIVIEKNKVKLKIIGATIQRTIDGTKPRFPEKIDDKDYGTVGGPIVVRKPVETTTTSLSQKRTLSLALYHLKSDADSYNFNPGSCSLNDPVIYPDKPQERRIPLRVEVKTSTNLKGPTIQRIDITPSTLKAKQYDPVTISAVFNNPSEVLSVTFSYTLPDGIPFNDNPMTPNPKGNFEAFIGTDTTKYAGEVKGTIYAKSKNPQVPLGTKEFKFEVMCGGENNVYGICVNNVCKSGTATISGGLPCAPFAEPSWT